MTEDTSAIFNEDGISFIPLRNWSRAGNLNFLCIDKSYIKQIHVVLNELDT